MSPQARAFIASEYCGGKGVVQIVRDLERRRYRAPKGGRWTGTTVRDALRRAGIYRPQDIPRTAEAAVRVMLDLAAAGNTISAIIEVLDAQGLRPARADRWRDSTVRRILERHGLRKPLRSDDDRFAKHVAPGGGDECDLWVGRKHRDGYGQFDSAGRNVLAHRWSWERRHGALAPGVQLHHVCRRPNCVRTAHMVPVDASTHQALQREEDVIVAGVKSGALLADLEALKSSPDSPDWPIGENRVGAVRPKLGGQAVVAGTA